MDFRCALVVSLLVSAPCFIEGESVTLVGGNGLWNGTVLVNHNGQWGTICDDNFDIHEAAVICRQLGFSFVVPQAFGIATFGAGGGPILMDDTNCNGSELDIATCAFGGWGRHNCQHTEDSGVSCHQLDIRLVGLGHPYVGNLEVLNSDGVWGKVDGRGFTDSDAVNICSYLGFTNGKPKWTSSMGANSGAVYKGNFTQISGILMTSPFTTSNTHNFDVNLDCLYSSYEARLVNGSYPLQGRLEFLQNGVWGLMCSDNFTQADASVICRSLSSSISMETIKFEEKPVNIGYPQPFYYQNIKCNGRERFVTLCPGFQLTQNTCTSSRYIYLSCPSTPIKLQGGATPWEGQLVVALNGTYGTVCNNGFSTQDAASICEFMGLGNGSAEILNNTYSLSGLTPLPILLDNLKCSKDARDITDCMTSSWHIFQPNCSNEKTVGIRCGLKDVRLMSGSHPHEGRVEVKINGVWSTVCDEGWDDADAQVVCDMLVGYPNDKLVKGKGVRGGIFGPGKGPVALTNVMCNGTEQDLLLCIRGPSKWLNCDHSRDAGVICSVSSTAQLVDGPDSSSGSLTLNGNLVCDTNWNEADSRVACRQLGYWSTSPVTHKGNWYGTAQDLHNTTDFRPACRGSEQTLFLCDEHPYSKNANCSLDHVIGLHCLQTDIGREHVRLVDGTSTGKGRLEVYHNGNWGAFCADQWTQANTEVVCRMMGFRLSRSPNFWSQMSSHPLLISRLQCNGTESDIGFCLADLNAENCGNELVHLDCTDNTNVHVYNSSGLGGQTLISDKGVSQNLCTIGYTESQNINNAHVLCSMLGYTGTKNVSFQQSTGINGSNIAVNVSCSGWEEHIRQCNNIGQVNCSSNNISDINCFGCLETFVNSSGWLVSANYPGVYNNNADCLFIVAPPKNEGPFKLVINDLNMAGLGDYIEVRESPFGTKLGVYSLKQNIPLIGGHSFYIRFISDASGVARGFNISWNPLSLSDVIHSQCGHNHWNIMVNMTLLKLLYPDAGVSSIYLNRDTCIGKVIDDMLVFDQMYTDCMPKTQVTNTSVVYYSTLVYPDSPTPFPLIVKRYKWKVTLECKIDRHTHVTQQYLPTDPTTATIGQTVTETIIGNNSYGIKLQMFSDPNFYKEISGHPVVAHIGSDIYVKVSLDTNDPRVKMRLETCSAKPQVNADVSQTYTLIQNGCPVDPDTTIISQGSHETRFVFNAFEFPMNHQHVYVDCSAEFCDVTDTSPLCVQTCSRPRHLKKRPF